MSHGPTYNSTTFLPIFVNYYNIIIIIIIIIILFNEMG